MRKKPWRRPEAFDMQQPKGSDGARRFFWAMMFGLPIAFIGFGILMIVAGGTNDARLPWVGGGLVVAGAVGLLAAWSFRRRRWSY